MFLYVLQHSLQRDKSDQDIKQLERSLKSLQNESEMLRQRFISTIEIMQDGIAFCEEDGSMFGSDLYVSIMGLKDNVFHLNNLQELMYKDDRIAYQKALEKTTKRYPVYKVKYRIKNGEDLLWVSEVGKRIILDKKESFISIIKPMNIKLFPDTEIDVLNVLKSEKEMYRKMQQLLKEKKTYYLVYIELTNIPNINDKFGRDVGDLMMGEYLKKLQVNIMNNKQNLFRISGIRFGLIIDDPKKFEFFERALTGSGELLNLQMVFGGVTQTVYPNLGIAESPYLGKSPDTMMKEAKKALELSITDESNKNYCFYKRI
jgi:GGDEF domain-containing protein